MVFFRFFQQFRTPLIKLKNWPIGCLWIHKQSLLYWADAGTDASCTPSNDQAPQFLRGIFAAKDAQFLGSAILKNDV